MEVLHMSTALPHKGCDKQYEWIPHIAHEWHSEKKGGPYYCEGISTQVIHLSGQPETVEKIWDCDSLTEIDTRQFKIQESLGFNPDDMITEEKIYYAKDQTLALLSEVHEALDEIGWKSWATSRHFNRDAFVGELVDALHFLMNLFIIAECPPHEIFSKYIAKNEKNIARQ